MSKGAGYRDKSILTFGSPETPDVLMGARGCLMASERYLHANLFGESDDSGSGDDEFRISNLAGPQEHRAVQREGDSATHTTRFRHPISMMSSIRVALSFHRLKRV